MSHADGKRNQKGTPWTSKMCRQHFGLSLASSRRRTWLRCRRHHYCCYLLDISACQGGLTLPHAPAMLWELNRHESAEQEARGYARTSTRPQRERIA